MKTKKVALKLKAWDFDSELPKDLSHEFVKVMLLKNYGIKPFEADKIKVRFLKVKSAYEQGVMEKRLLENGS